MVDPWGLTRSSLDVDVGEEDVDEEDEDFKLVVVADFEVVGLASGDNFLPPLRRLKTSAKVSPSDTSVMLLSIALSSWKFASAPPRDWGTGYENPPTSPTRNPPLGSESILVELVDAPRSTRGDCAD